MARDTVRSKWRATYEDLLRVPDTMVGEIVGGDLVVSPRPATSHAYAATEIAGDLVPAFHGVQARTGPGGWWILPEPAVTAVPSHRRTPRTRPARAEPFAALEISLARWWLPG